jgi:hypothetical protein
MSSTTRPGYPSRNGNSARSEAERRESRARTARARGNRRFAAPMQYDESGFPIPQRPPTFADRVRRLLAG